MLFRSKALGPHVHHHDVVRAALTRMAEQLTGPDRDDALRAIQLAAHPGDELAAIVRTRDYARLRDVIRNRPAEHVATMLADLSIEERFKRLAKEQGSSAEMMRGILLFQAHRREQAIKCFEGTGTALGQAIVAHLATPAPASARAARAPPPPLSAPSPPRASDLPSFTLLRSTSTRQPVETPGGQRSQSYHPCRGTSRAHSPGRCAFLLTLGLGCAFLSSGPSVSGERREKREAGPDE